MKGYFISVEGGDGSGKSTQMQKIEAYLTEMGQEVLLTREPGGTPMAEKIREMILDPANRDLTGRAEMLLYAAARAQHVEEKILPALRAGKTVLSDRFTDSSIAYQGFGRALGDMVAEVNRIATGGVEPDLTCLGKIIGGGMPVGAFGGRREVMDALAPTGPVYQAGTLSGNPIAMAAGFACLNEVAQPGVHETLTELTNQLAQGLLDAARDAGIPLVVNNVGGMFGIFFTDAETVTCYQDVVKCDVERFKRFFHLMLEEGVYLAPSAFEAGFMSVAHSEEDIDNTIDAARRVFAKL